MKNTTDTDSTFYSEDDYQQETGQVPPVDTMDSALVSKMGIVLVVMVSSVFLFCVFNLCKKQSLHRTRLQKLEQIRVEKDEKIAQMDIQIQDEPESIQLRQANEESRIVSKRTSRIY